MRKEWIVVNERIFENDECIMVDNDNLSNEVINIPLKKSEVIGYTDKDTIGVWKIKKLK